MATEHKYSMPLVIKFQSHKVPVFYEDKNKAWVYYGEKNDYPEYLLKIFNRSPKHNAIINNKVNYLVGGGLTINMNGLSVEQQASLLQVLKENDFDSLVKKCTIDYELFGGLAVEIIWDRGGNKPILNHIGFNKLRSDKENEEFYYTKNWVKYKKDGTYAMNQRPDEEEDFAIYPAYDPDNKKGAQVLYFKEYRPNLDVYPFPEYIGANVAIETDIEINNYHYNNLKNGFTATVLINFNNGIPTPEEQETIHKQITDKLTSSDNAGKFILSFSDGKDKSAEVTVLTMSDADKQFENLRKDTTQEIFIGHRINNGMLFGVKEAGQLGGRTELIESYELFQNNYVKPKQKTLLKIFNELLSFYGFDNRLEFKQYVPIGLDFTTPELFNFLTTRQKQEKLGLPISKEETTKQIDALNSLNPVVLAKVLENMSQSELRALAGLKDEPVVTTTVTERREFKKEFTSEEDEATLAVFSKYGRPKSEFRFIKSEHFCYESDEALDTQEAAMQFKELSANDKAVLDLLSKDPLMSPENLAKALKISTKDVKGILESLTAKKLIKSGVSKIGEDKQKVKEPTKKGETQAEDAKTVETFVVYSYEWRSGFSDADFDTSRPFCQKLMNLDRVYTRKEIESISREVGYSVFLHRGGFYRVPDTNKTLPYCRHQWEMHLVQKEV